MVFVATCQKLLSPLFTFQEGFLFWEEEAASAAPHQCNKFHQPEPGIQNENNFKGYT